MLKLVGAITLIAAAVVGTAIATDNLSFKTDVKVTPHGHAQLQKLRNSAAEAIRDAGNSVSEAAASAGDAAAEATEEKK